MNGINKELILELAKQSELVKYNSDSKLSEVEKFAELIVKECIGVIEESEGYSRYFPHVVENIEKHFGVE